MHLIGASLAAAVLGMATLASAHMEMTNPPPMRSSKNKFSTNIDYEMKSPLSPDGSNYPCRGSINLLGTPQGQSVASWAAGSAQSFTVDGGAFHNGGSCQASLSYDKGKTWTVIHSYVGNCPSGAGPTNYDFTVPADAAAGEALFAWSWFNNVGNREMYMNCAVVTIAGGKSGKRRGAAMSSRPTMFTANIGNGCGTTEGKDVAFPDPGPDVTDKGSNTAPPTGKCATGSSSPNPGTGGGSSSQSSAAPQPSTSASSAVPSSGAVSSSVVATSSASPTLPGGVYVTISVTSSASSGAASATAAPSSVAASSSASAPPASQPTTIATSIRPTAPSNSSAAAPSNTGSPAPTGTPTSGGSSGSSFAAGAACDSLGSWNCIGGSQFQRCASGNMWSPAQALAAGTKCQSGVSENLVML